MKYPTDLNICIYTHMYVNIKINIIALFIFKFFSGLGVQCNMHPNQGFIPSTAKGKLENKREFK